MNPRTVCIRYIAVELASASASIYAATQSEDQNVADVCLVRPRIAADKNRQGIDENEEQACVRNHPLILLHQVFQLVLVDAVADGAARHFEAAGDAGDVAAGLAEGFFEANGVGALARAEVGGRCGRARRGCFR